MPAALQGLSRWPPEAIHDTVASIVSKPPFGGLRQSLLGRFLDYLADQLDRFFKVVGKMPGGRYVAIGCAVLIVLTVIARVVMARRLRDSVRRGGSRGAANRSSGDLLLESRQLAEQGRYTDAAHALYFAVLDRVAVRDRLRLHSSKTSGDYARELRARSSSSYAAFRSFSRRFDRVIFGVGACSPDEYAALLRDAEPMLEIARAA